MKSCALKIAFKVLKHQIFGSCIFHNRTTQGPRINTCSESPSHGLFLTGRGEDIFKARGKINMYTLFNAYVVI
jgi:hypothetical protein